MWWNTRQCRHQFRQHITTTPLFFAAQLTVCKARAARCGECVQDAVRVYMGTSVCYDQTARTTCPALSLRRASLSSINCGTPWRTSSPPTKLNCQLDPHVPSHPISPPAGLTFSPPTRSTCQLSGPASWRASRRFHQLRHSVAYMLNEMDWAGEVGLDGYCSPRHPAFFEPWPLKDTL